MMNKSYIVDLANDHPFLISPSVEDYVKRANGGDIKVYIVAEMTEGRESVNFCLYTLHDNFLSLKSSLRGHMDKAKIIGEFSEKKLIQSLELGSRYGV